MCVQREFTMQKVDVKNKFNNSKYENLHTQKQVIISVQYNVDLEK